MSGKKCGGSAPLEKFLCRCLAFALTTMPFTLPIWGWQFWYLRPVILYASILPYLFVPIALLSVLPIQLCVLFGILDKAKEEAKLVVTRRLREYLWRPYMRIMHGYEVKGIENLPPNDKGGLIVFYHGVIPLDVVFFALEVLKHQGRLVGGTVHRGVLKIPVLGNVLQVYGFSAEGREKAIDELKGGALKAVSPGGDYETMFSENYSVHFGKRCGFAAAAKEAKVPVIPMFTENVREFQRCHYFGFRSFFEYMLTEHGLPTLWGFGGLPVKLRTHLGEPLYCGENESAPEFADRVKKAIEDLRDANQKMDNSMFRALMDRFS